MLPKPPQPEPPRIWALDDLAPDFRVRIDRILAELTHERVFESMRTNARQSWLYGFGRTWADAGRQQPVTNAKDALGGWHVYGLAVDIVEDDATPWQASTQFWQLLGAAAERHGCAWGGRWKALDLPHVQSGRVPRSPTSADRALYASGGVAAVWRKYGVDRYSS
jgi:hypothetical protein